MAADKKITDLAALTGANIAKADKFVLVDVSDMSMAATSRSRPGRCRSRWRVSTT
jgi:hypothetical protein